MELIIEPGRTEKNYWRDLWRFRELFYFLAWRDILVRYKQTTIGVAWALIRPFLTMLIFTFTFSRVANMKAPPGIHYSLMVFAAMLPWQFFATAMSEASNSLITNANLVSKIYFPRMVVPASAVITSFVDFLITLFLLAGMMVWFAFLPGWQLMALPFYIALAFAAAMGIGLWLCALNVEYRDFRYVVPFVVQFGLFISPVGYSTDRIPQKWQLLYSLNPMVGVIDGFRWALLRGKFDISAERTAASIIVTILLCVSGLWYFRKMEKSFADVI